MKKMDDFAYYKCKECGKKYLEYPPEFCGCGSHVFDYVLGDDWWTKSGQRVLSTLER